MKTMTVRPNGAGRAEMAVTAAGTTSFEFIQGRDEGTAVFIHGFAIPSGVWEKNFYALSEGGHSVLRFDRFGTGRSPAAAAAAQTIDLFLTQLKELVEMVRPPLPLSLIGLSLGGAVAAQFAARYPALIRKLCLIAPAVPAALPGGIRLMGLPGLGETFVRLFIRSLLRRNLAFAIPSAGDEAFIRECLAQARKPGYRNSLLSVVRNLLPDRAAFDYAAIPPAVKPVTLVWGTADRVMPYRFADDVRRALGPCRFLPLPGAGHCPPRERAEEMNALLAEWWAE